MLVRGGPLWLLWKSNYSVNQELTSEGRLVEAPGAHHQGKAKVTGAGGAGTVCSAAGPASSLTGAAESVDSN